MHFRNGTVCTLATTIWWSCSCFTCEDYFCSKRGIAHCNLLLKITIEKVVTILYVNEGVKM